MDTFTHGHGWLVQLVPVLQAPLFTLSPLLTGRTMHIYDVLPLGGPAIALRHVGGPQDDIMRVFVLAAIGHTVGRWQGRQAHPPAT